MRWGREGASGGAEVLVNYNTGQVSGFLYGGAGVGFSNLVSADVTSSAIYGLGNDNSRCKGEFTTGGVSAGTPVSVGISFSGSSGGLQPGLQNIAPNGQVASSTASAGIGFVRSFSAAATLTNYTQALNLGKYWMLLNPGAFASYIMKQICGTSCELRGRP